METKRTTIWINKILSEADKLDDAGIEMLHVCGAECAKSSSLLEGAMKVFEKNSKDYSVDKIFNEFKEEYYNKPTLNREGNQITLIFDTCTCPLVAQGVSHPFLCNCTVGYTKIVFETLFGKSVEVKLLKSILWGDDVCEQDILIS